MDFTPSSPCPEDDTRTNGFSDLGSSLPSRLVVRLEAHTLGHILSYLEACFSRRNKSVTFCFPSRPFSCHFYSSQKEKSCVPVSYYILIPSKFEYVVQYIHPGKLRKLNRLKKVSMYTQCRLIFLFCFLYNWKDEGLFC